MPVPAPEFKQGDPIDESAHLAAAAAARRHHREQSCKGLHTTNVAYGGADGRDLFITESETGTILRARLDVPGKTMFSHKP